MSDDKYSYFRRHIMKKIIGFIVLSIALIACNNEESQLNTAKQLYEKGVLNGDPSTTVVALNQLLLLDSTNVTYQDSLSRMYLTAGNYKAGIRYAEKVFNAGKADIKLKETMAVGYQQIGQLDKSEEFIANLLVETNDYKYLYQSLAIQFESRNQAKFDSLAQDILDKIESDSTIASALVPMPGPLTGVKQMVPIKAATYFLIGNNALELRRNMQDIEVAVTFLQQSIEEYDQFEMSRYLLMEIEKMMMANRR